MSPSRQIAFLPSPHATLTQQSCYKLYYYNMKRNALYEAPALEICLIAMERGFAQSLGGVIKDFENGGDDSLDE